MPKQWFILHALSGHELKVQKNIASRVQQEEMEDIIGEVLIPTEKVSEVKQGKKTTVNRKFFPGYVLINIWDKPAPLSDDDVNSIVNQIEEKKETVAPKVMFEPGELVKITDGPFLNFSGVIEEVDPERGKLKISVSIFGRSAPVELEYWQVERSAE